METRKMGRHGLEVPALCLGTMTFGLQVDEAGSRAILDKAADHGLTYLDTSDAYPVGGTTESAGETEEILGRWMKDKRNRDDLLITTKCFAPTGGVPIAGASRGSGSWTRSRAVCADSVRTTSISTSPIWTIG
jgi:aryl-alcohol dehydrogenase-like predicted oxidoreductase